MLDNKLKITIMKNEFWWGGAVEDANQMPLTETSDYSINLTRNITYNQATSFFISNKGRYIWSSKGFDIIVSNGVITIFNAKAEIIVKEGLDNLRNAFLDASQNFFKPNGKIPNEMMFSSPQYCTWIEMMNNQNQVGIIEYAESIVSCGMPAGEFIIDDGWQIYNGFWEFDYNKFSNPLKMVRRLHELGYKVLLWIAPFISPDTEVYRLLEKKGCLVRNASGKTAIRYWWNGHSAVLDLTNPEAVKWMKEQFKRLRNDYGVDGFKQDAGDAQYYFDDDICFDSSIDANGQCELWADLALNEEFNELRACYNKNGQNITQRLSDKAHSWTEKNGLKALIPSATQLGLCGYPYVCPDMIGGGLSKDFENFENIDHELFVRSCQCSALMPMMQYSYSIWKEKEMNTGKICSDFAKLHYDFSDYIIKYAKNAAITGEPIIRNMEYMHPNCGYAKIKDQFFLGDDYLVAPVLEKGAITREVVLPNGNWKDINSDIIYDGGITVTVAAELDTLPIFIKIDNVKITVN